MLNLPPDSGHWRYNEKINQWEETDQTPSPEFDEQQRQEGFPLITVDGFPRQGNRMARLRILSGMPPCAMPYTLGHSQKVIERAHHEGHKVFHSLREPIDSISSYITMMTEHQKQPLRPDEYAHEKIFYELQQCLYAKEDFELIEKCFLFYIRLTNLAISMKDDTWVIPFDLSKSITGLEFVKRIRDALGIDLELNYSIDADINGLTSTSTSNTTLRQYLMSDKFAIIREQAEYTYMSAINQCRSI